MKTHPKVGPRSSIARHPERLSNVRLRVHGEEPEAFWHDDRSKLGLPRPTPDSRHILPAETG